MPYLIFALICSVWSVSFLLMKKAAIVYSPAMIGFGRVFGGALVLGVIWLWKRPACELRRADWPLLIGVSVIGFVGPFFVQPIVIRNVSSAFMAMVVSLVPLLTVVLSHFVLGVRPTRRQLIGVAGALICMGVLMMDGWQRVIPLTQFALAASVPLGYALANVLIRGRLRHVPALELTLASLFVSSVCLLPVALAYEPPTHELGTHVRDAGEPLAVDAAARGTSMTSDRSRSRDSDRQLGLASLIFLGLVSTGLGNALFNKLIRDHGPLFAGMTTNVVPVGALIWGWLDSETVSAYQLLALAGILSMVTLVQFGAATQDRVANQNQPPGELRDD